MPVIPELVWGQRREHHGSLLATSIGKKNGERQIQ